MISYSMGFASVSACRIDSTKGISSSDIACLANSPVVCSASHDRLIPMEQWWMVYSKGHESGFGTPLEDETESATTQLQSLQVVAATVAHVSTV